MEEEEAEEGAVFLESEAVILEKGGTSDPKQMRPRG